MSFDGKQVCIDIPVIELWYENIGAILPFSKADRIFPVSLRVNAESRTETLRHYSFVSVSDVFEDLPGWPKHCLNLGLDCFFVIKQLWASASHQKRQEKWLDYLDSTGKGGLAKLKHLEVKEFYWDHKKYTPDHRYEVQNEQLRPGTTYAFMLPLMKLILRLNGLQVLCLTWHKALTMQARQTFLKLDESRAMMQEFLERHQDNFVGGRAPEVQIR